MDHDECQNNSKDNQKWKNLIVSSPLLYSRHSYSRTLTCVHSDFYHFLVFTYFVFRTTHCSCQKSFIRYLFWMNSFEDLMVMIGWYHTWVPVLYKLISIISNHHNEYCLLEEAFLWAEILQKRWSCTLPAQCSFMCTIKAGRGGGNRDINTWPVKL